MVPESLGHLVTLGLEPDEAEIYLELLSAGPFTAEQLAAESGRAVRDVRGCFAVLADYGLAGPAGGGPAMAALRPESGLEVLSRRREAELARARLAVTRVFDQRRRPAEAGPRFVEVVPAARARRLECGARVQVRVLVAPPYDDEKQIECANLARGIAYRAVYARSALERPEFVTENVMPCAKAGEDARILPEVGVKLCLVDAGHAVLWPQAPGPVLVIRPSPVFDALAGLFEMSWQAAQPLGLTVDGPGPAVRPGERRLLGLLAAGLTDDQVARVLGVSRRTVCRHLEALMARTGAASRFQLALHAARNDWIPGPVQPRLAPAPSLRA